MAVLGCTIASLSADAFGPFEYKDKGESITITRYQRGIIGPVEIPSTIKGKPVTSIGMFAFAFSKGLSNVTIPNGVTDISLLAFLGCPDLSCVNIPASVTDCDGAFGSNSLTTINVDSHNASYSSLDGVLYDKNQTTLILCPGCKVGAVSIPASVTKIKDNAFSGCADLTSITIPDSVTIIEDDGFSACKRLSSITIPARVTSIGKEAFSSCSALTSVNVPASVTSIGEGAFSHCPSLKEITVDSKNANYSSVDGLLYNKNQTKIIQCPCGKKGVVTISAGVIRIEDYAFSRCSGLTSIMIPTGVTTIGNGAFSDCGALACVSIPAGVTAIEDSAFYNCTSLVRVTIPASVTRIGGWAFSDCSALTSVTLNNGITSIGTWAFSSCDKLTSVTIPASATCISDAFAYNTGLTDITVDPSNANYSSLDGMLFDKKQTSLMLCPGGKSGNITIPASVTNIEDRAFNSCANLTEITVDSHNADYSSLDGVLFNKSQTMLIRCPERKQGNYIIPAGVTSIGGEAFCDCTGLTNVTIPVGVTGIGYRAFTLCSGITGITIPTSVTSVGEGAFSFCHGLTSLTIPTSVTSIGDEAFSDCIGLTAITVDSQNANYSSLNGILFDKKQTSLIQCPGGKDGSVTIPAGVISIEKNAFSSCAKMTSVTIPASVTAIGDNAFYSCTSLTRAHINGNAPSMGDTVFENTAKDFTVYYLEGKTGFTSPKWNGYKAEVERAPQKGK